MKSSHLKKCNFIAPEITSLTWTLDWKMRGVWRTAGLFLFALMLLACGQAESGKSGYRADLVFPENIPRLPETSKIDCIDAGIDTVVFNFIADGLQYGPKRFDCEAHNAVITDVPAGKGITVEVFADDSNGDAILQGSEVIDIPKDQITTGGRILMQHVLTDLTTDTDNDAANFNGAWIITDSPEGCYPHVWQTKYPIIIDQRGSSATITAMIDICPTEIEVPCTVSGDELNCDDFLFYDYDGWSHSHTELKLGYVTNNRISGSFNWSLYTDVGQPACRGMSTLIGTREESEGVTEE